MHAVHETMKYKLFNSLHDCALHGHQVPNIVMTNSDDMLLWCLMWQTDFISLAYSQSGRKLNLQEPWTLTNFPNLDALNNKILQNSVKCFPTFERRIVSIYKKFWSYWISSLLRHTPRLDRKISLFSCTNILAECQKNNYV